jgi:hypothetical protein
MEKYTIDPFIYRPPNADPREIFNVIEFENIVRGRYLISIYGRVYDAIYEGFLNKKEIKNRTWSGSYYYENYCKFDVFDHTQEFKSIPLIVLSSFREYRPDYKIIHLNGDTLDDNLYNLSYGNYIDIPDKIYFPSSNNKKYTVTHNGKLPIEQVELICKLLEKNIHPSMIAEQTGVPWRDVYNIKTLKAYVNISKQYSFRTHKGGIYDIDKYNQAMEEINS